MPEFLPISRQELKQKNIDQLDFIYVSGDAYVDHPSFGAAIITRVLEEAGFTVGVIAQPDWRSERDFQKLGEPNYAFLVSSGNIDSMVTHYTSAKRLRSTDAYAPGGKAGKRPDRAVIVYSRMLKQCYPTKPVIIGGLEASLRRFAHYDYWDDRVRPSVLADAGADLLIYGMGELQTREIAKQFQAGSPVKEMTAIRGTCYLTEPVNTPLGAVECPNFDIVSTDKKSYAKAARQQMDEQDEVYGRTIIQRHGNQMLVQNPPMRSLTQEELDAVFALPYMRTYHPVYEPMGGVPAIKEVEFSITHNRGCFGACNFCSIAFHQGRRVTCRSEKSVLAEAESFTKSRNFKGYIHDVGGPTANFRKPSCTKQLQHGLCRGKKCLAPKPCPALEADHTEYLELLRKLRAVKGVKRVFIRSGIRYDYMLEDRDGRFLDELVRHHISGQLRVAPEHCSNHVLDAMGKPHIEAYHTFQKDFYKKTGQAGKEQYLVPYLMSSHPGCTVNDAIELAVFLKKEKIHPEQVQDFYPTPGTISTCMYYTGLNPYTMEQVFVPKTKEHKAVQRALLQYFLPQNQEAVLKALKQAKRFDLIGKGKNALVEDSKSTCGKNASVNRQAFSGKQRRTGKGKAKWQKETTKRKGNR